jgi:uncharacterized pyridoxamine 5'-phosphate oxidase family protein
MSKKPTIPDLLTSDQMAKLNLDTLILLSTIDYESNGPSVSAISWVKALSAKKIRFSVTNNSRIYANINANPSVTVCFIGLGTVYSISGTANIMESKMDGIAMPLAKIEVEVQAVFESMFWGAQITQEPVYEKTYDLAKANALDQQVYSALIH